LLCASASEHVNANVATPTRRIQIIMSLSGKTGGEV